MPSQPPPDKGVDYNSHLWHSAHRECWGKVTARESNSITVAVGIFVVIMAIAWASTGNASLWMGVLCAFVGLAGLFICYAVRFLSYLFYFTPRRLMADKQRQLLAERARFEATIATLAGQAAGETDDRVAATLERLVLILKSRHSAQPVAALYEAGAANLEPAELDDLCHRLVKLRIPHPFAGIPNEADYWLWLLQTALDRGLDLSTHDDLAEYHEAVQIENAPLDEVESPAVEMTGAHKLKA